MFSFSKNQLKFFLLNDSFLYRTIVLLIMYFENLFEKYKEWEILRIFLQNPKTGFYTKELARKTKIGAGTINTFLKNIHEDKILNKEIIGNVHLYSLNNENEIVKQLKILNTILEITKYKLTEKILKKDDTLTSMILYGSHANGENDEKSDIDLLIISSNKANFTTTLQQLEIQLKKPISLQILSINQWNRLKTQDEIFYQSIIENHIILYGSGLP